MTDTLREALEILDSHSVPLHRKVRGEGLSALAGELAHRAPGFGIGGPEQLVSQVLRVRQLAEDKLDAYQRVERRWDDFTRRFYARTDDQGRRQVMSDYLTETTVDLVRRRADLAALDRCLDYDALRERHRLERHHILVAIELAITFISKAGTAALDHAEARGRERIVREMIGAGEVGGLLGQVVETSPRWQIRRAALDGLIGIARIARQRDPAWLAQLCSRQLGLAVRCAMNLEEHAWVQGRAMELVMVLSDELGIDLVTKRLLDPAAGPSRIDPRRSAAQQGSASPYGEGPPCGGPRDFLVRRQLVDLLANGDERARDVLRRALVQRDPSEHVRQGIAEAFARMGAYRELAMLAGLDPQSYETSARVRATAVEAGCRFAGAAEVGAAAQLVIEVLDRDTAPLPLAIACEAAVSLGTRSLDLELGTALLAAVLRVASHPERLPATQEIAAAAAERLRTTFTREARAWTEFLVAFTKEIPPGRSRSISLTRLRELPPLPADPMFLGRILAQLSRRDFPLCATRDGSHLVVWRGDRFRRRLWRVLHELRSRRPNKRQGHRHTVGRVMKGLLRAPPGGLDEVTATVVPGERVHVAGEAGWGRHLPTVDDVLDLPVVSGDVVNVFSSHGVATIRPPSGFWARLRNRLILSLRYASLAALRLQSLAGAEPHTRQRFCEQLRDTYGIHVTFTPYEYPDHRAFAPRRLTELFVRPHPESVQLLGAEIESRS